MKSSCALSKGGQQACDSYDFNRILRPSLGCRCDLRLNATLISIIPNLIAIRCDSIRPHCTGHCEQTVTFNDP